jgi:hypothetical protein
LYGKMQHLVIYERNNDLYIKLEHIYVWYRHDQADPLRKKAMSIRRGTRTPRSATVSVYLYVSLYSHLLMLVKKACSLAPSS